MNDLDPPRKVSGTEESQRLSQKMRLTVLCLVASLTRESTRVRSFKGPYKTHFLMHLVKVLTREFARS
jgi:hypothetical protein